MKEFYKYLLLAQVASDSGKQIVSSKAASAKNAAEAGYALKDTYIAQAIACAKKVPHVKVGRDFDEYNEMQIILFEIKGMGQVSFHSFRKWETIPLDIVQWDGKRGGSSRTCMKIGRKYNLPFHNHKKRR